MIVPSFAIMWLGLGIFCLGFTGYKMGFLRWTDLMVIPLGPTWFLTPYWWDEDGKKMWQRKKKRSDK